MCTPRKYADLVTEVFDPKHLKGAKRSSGVTGCGSLSEKSVSGRPQNPLYVGGGFRCKCLWSSFLHLVYMSEKVEFETRDGGQVTFTVEQSDVSQTQVVITADVEDDQATIPLDAEAHDKIQSVVDLVTKERAKTVEDALKEAKETGEPVQVGQKRTTYCNDITKECDIDHVRTMAYPSGEVKEERIHTL